MKIYQVANIMGNLIYICTMYRIKGDPPMHSELFIRKVNRYSAGIVLKLVAELWKTLPELTVYPIGNLYTIDTIAEYLGRESDNHVLVMNLL